MKLEFERHFTKEDEKPYDGVTWKTFDAIIEDVKNPSGYAFKQEGVEFPDYFSQTAVNIIASKYFSGLQGTEQREFSFRQTISRVVETIRRWGIQQQYFEDESANIFADELIYMLLHQMVSFNSPVWFNVGNPASKPQVSGCYIVSAEDTMESILDNLITEGLIFKYGSGAGSNRSKIRSSREHLSGGGLASGPCSFMKSYDSVADTIKSGGKTRRAAKMEILDADHGDIVKFIGQKAAEEKIAKILIAAGLSPEFNDPEGAYAHVQFQNSNQAVRVRNAFMQAVEKDDDWALLERYSQNTSGNIISTYMKPQGQFADIDGNDYLMVGQIRGIKVIEWMKAKALMKIIATQTWESGDPGMQFHDEINKWHTCKASGEITASNPCSEYMFLDDTSCNLASWRLTKFLDAKNNFMYESFVYGTDLMITAMDIMIGKAHYPTEKIEEETRKYRTLGLGYADLGAFLMLKGLAYDSQEANNITSAITALMTGTAYKQSTRIAAAVGSFVELEKNRDSMTEVMNLHLQAVTDICKDGSTSPEVTLIANYALSKFRVNAEKGRKFRNAQVTVIAPTGTIAFMMDCDTTGPEPMLGLVQYKKLVGGGIIKIIPACVKQSLINLGCYTTHEIGLICNYIAETGELHPDLVHKEHVKIFATSFGNSNLVSYGGHLLMMAAIQPFISGAISKTINLPNDSSVDVIELAYKMAWDLKLKAVAIYRDGCKQSQPLNVKEKKAEPMKFSTHEEIMGEDKLLKFTTIANKNSEALENLCHERISHREKLPEIRDGVIHKFNIGGHKGFLIPGEYPDGKLGEIFLYISKAGSTLSALADDWAASVSIGLQYGVPLEVLVHKFKGTKYEPSGITQNADIRFTTSLSDYIMRFLENYYILGGRDKRKGIIEYVENGTQPIPVLAHASGAGKDNNLIVLNQLDTKSFTGNLCTVCGGIMQKTATCETCTSCGTTTGCS